MEPSTSNPRALLAAYGVTPSKNRGQNFLSHKLTAQAIVTRAKIAPGSAVLEIGPGLGALTFPLALEAGHVFAVEWDKRLCDFLGQNLKKAGIDNVTCIRADILKTDISEISKKAGAPLLVVGNLPYHISSQVLALLVKERAFCQKAVLMFQKEMAERIMAPPGNKTYGRLSVLAQYAAAIRPLASVSAKRFHPRPAVDSLVLEFVFEETPRFPVLSEELLFLVVRAAFSKRRKTLRNALASSPLGVSAKEAAQALTQAGVDPMRRAETLGIEEFARVSDALLPLLADKENQP